MVDVSRTKIKLFIFWYH